MKPTSWLLIVSGALGFYVGMVAFPTWQVAVETAQVVAGLVHYPPGNPFYIYHTKLWTILHQIIAVGLLAGLSEIALSKIFSGVLGMLSMQALAMVVFAFSRQVPLAVGAAFTLLVARATNNGATYPIRLMSMEHTYGSIGLSTFVLAVASIGAGAYGVGGFLVGLMPSVHPALGLWLWIVTAVCVLWDLRNARTTLRPGLWWFLSGAAVTTVSLAIQLLVTYDVPRIDPAESARYLDAFVRFWDQHRAPIDLDNIAVVLNRGLIALGLVWLVGLNHRVPDAAKFLLRFITLIGALAIGLAFLSWVPPEKMPMTVLMLMPSRLLNVDAMIFPAVLIGLLSLYRHRLGGQLLMAIFFVGLLISPRSMLWEWPEVGDWVPYRPVEDLPLLFGFTSLVLLLVAIDDWRRWQRRRRVDDFTETTAAVQSHPIVAWTGWAARGISFAVLVVALVMALRLRAEPGYYRDRTNDPFFAAVAAEPRGMVLTAGGYQLVQLYTRRPVLLCGTLDTLAYAPESGPAMQRILVDIYGADLFNPPDAAHRRSVLPRDVHRERWEHTTQSRWLELGNTYDITQIVTPVDWQLDLPVAAENQWFRLYRIPG